MLQADQMVVFILSLLLYAEDAMSMVHNALMPPLARSHCHVFIVLARTHTRVLALQNAYEQDEIHVYDHFPALLSLLEDLIDNKSRTDHDTNKEVEAYQILHPAFEQTAEWLKRKVDPARCIAHFIVAESELIPDGKTPHDNMSSTMSHVTRRMSQLSDQARRDNQFPFALNTLPPVRYHDEDSVTLSGDFHVVTASWRRYFHVIGTNYFLGRVMPSLSPGHIEVLGVLHVDAGGHTGRSRSESDANVAEMTFDVRERWRRSKRQRQVNVVLNVSDFDGHEYVGFGRLAVQQAVVKLEQDERNDQKTDTMQHPCFLKGHMSVVDGVNTTLEGSADANKCMSLLRSHVAASNANCPEEKFFFLNSIPQPQSLGSFYASGVVSQAVLRASRVLKHVSNSQDRITVDDQLQLPTPTLLALRNAAKDLCALPYNDIAAGIAPAHLLASETTTTVASVLEMETEPPSALCFDLCYTVVLLEQIGVEDNEMRVHFVDRFEKEPVISGRGSKATQEHESPSELVAWLTGAFLYLEALQGKVTFSMESKLLAEQISAGLPLGWSMSLVVFVVACMYLYFTTGCITFFGQRGGCSSVYLRVVNGSTKARYKDTTQSITFVEDAQD